ncbi:MAG: CRISPR-associated helicase Cas3' [Dehalococcoidia bacterium]|nr:CRISPR-associated helicase Cas3' [Dehalococcoidia bacterium]
MASEFPEPLAHISEDGKPHLLIDHLRSTAQTAAEFAAEFGCAEWGYMAGLWHDFGKYSIKFQQYIRAVNGIDAHLEGKTGRVDHSTAGGLHAIDTFGMQGRLLSYLIAGHHAGLPDWEADRTGNAALSQRLKNVALLDSARESSIPADILNSSLPKDRPKPGADPALWIRLLFSCVVDADFLDAEAFFEPDRAVLRGDYRELSELLARFSDYMQKKQSTAADTKVNRVRSRVFAQCIAKAAEPPGIYTLTVPTGGGKTLSSMAFALHHATKYNKRRIIYVIPYTSIIEQTADQFRAIFGDAVVEHHSNLDVTDETRDNPRSRLACENWDAPVIVTTSVQFFESLFASRTSRCRKLHNIVNSVVILDEAQLLPPDFLNPILHVLRELQKNYRVTLLLTTATQPALGPQPQWGFAGLPDTKEIVADPVELHDHLKRVEITIPYGLEDPKSWDELAVELAQHPTVLCIVNRRDDCRLLWEKMPEGTFHLSALMCGAHRSGKIAEIKQRLKEGIPTRVISTQLVEAGVDVDFPVVYRGVAGLDSVAQAAGRCNREGLREKGMVMIFSPPSKVPPGHLRQAAEIGRRLMTQECPDILAPDRFEEFFKEFYWLQGPNLDKHGILTDLRMSNDFRCSFRTAAQNFHLIDETQQAPVIVAYREGAALIEILERDKPDRRLMRKLQRFVVNLPRYLHARLLSEGALREPHPGIYVQGHGALYHEDLGFRPDKSIVYEPDELMC